MVVKRGCKLHTFYSRCFGPFVSIQRKGGEGARGYAKRIQHRSDDRSIKHKTNG